MITPVWPAPANVRAVCSTREGGFSTGPYAGLNVGDHVGDNAQAVARNRQHFAQTLSAHPVFLKQVHGWDVAELVASTPDGQTADASATVVSGVACTVMVADCLPVLFCSADGAVVAAAHAGWRGLLGKGGYGVLEATVERFKPSVQVAYAQSAIDTVANDAADEVSESTLLAWLGPCIGPQAFEVGVEVREAFMQGDAACDALFKPLGDGKFSADLAGLARLRLQHMGVTRVYGNDGSTAWCTVSNPSQFFSHRRDVGISGRFCASIWRV